MQVTFSTLSILSIPAASGLTIPFSRRKAQLVGEAEMAMPFESWPVDQLAMDGMAMLGTCNLSQLLDGFTTASAAVSDSDMFAGMSVVADAYSYLKQIAQSTCSESDQKKFVSAMTDFETCSGFDVLAFIESFPSAAFGSWLECLLGVLAESDPILLTEGDPTAAASVTLPQRCVTDLYGPNPLGNLARQMTLHPDQVRPCFATLSDNLPACNYEVWPIPVVGDWVKKASCLLGASKDLDDHICEAELHSLAKCLPAEVGTASDCETTIKACSTESVYMSLPKPLLGAPLSDTCQRVAKEKSLSVAVERYKSFQKQCAAPWDGWKDTVASTTTTTNFLGVSNNSVSSTGSSSALSVALAFVGGAVVASVILILVVFRQQRRSKTYDQVASSETEMISSSGELSLTIESA